MPGRLRSRLLLKMHCHFYQLPALYSLHYKWIYVASFYCENLIFYDLYSKSIELLQLLIDFKPNNPMKIWALANIWDAMYIYTYGVTSLMQNTYGTVKHGHPMKYNEQWNILSRMINLYEFTGHHFCNSKVEKKIGFSDLEKYCLTISMLK